MEEKETKKEKTFYKKWWFWVIIVIILIMALGTNNQNLNTQQTLNNDNQTAEDSPNKLEVNPYKSSQEYNGVYTFSLSSDNSSGYAFSAIGAISFSEGNCKIKYNKYNDSIPTESKVEYDGYCGLNKQDNEAFYFTIKDKNSEELYTYKCTKTDKNLVCEQKSEFDLAGCTNNNLNLIYANNTQDLDTAFQEIVNQEEAKKEEEEKAKKEQEKIEFKASCQTYTFEQMARNPENFKGTNVKITGEVIQALYGSKGVDLRVNITKQGSYTTYYTDTIYVVYYPEDGEDKILEDDIITIYGTSQGDYTYTSTLGAPVTLPLVYGKYIEID